MRTLLFAILIGLILIFYFQGGAEILSFDYLKDNLQALNSQYRMDPLNVMLLFSGAYLLLTSLSIPGSLVLTILAGAIFGSFNGVILVTTAGTIGAMLSFLMSRYLFKDYLNQKFKRHFQLINRHLEKDGLIYIFALRFIPVSPFVIINIVLGLTSIKLRSFLWTTYLGMLPGNIIYVYAGKRIHEINAPSEIMTPAFLISLTVLGLLPFLGKKLVSWRRLRHFAP